jgi:hypothetical protein
MSGHSRTLPRAAFLPSILALLTLHSSCGDGGGGGGRFDTDGVDFRGNVSSIVFASRSRPPPTLFARAYRALAALVMPSAVAEPGCTSAAGDLLACAATAGGESCDVAVIECRPVDASCEFAVGVEVSCFKLAGLSFVEDANGNGELDSSDREAPLVFHCSSEDPEFCRGSCNGDEIEARNVEVRFFATPIEGDNGVARAEDLRRVERGCIDPTPTPEPTPRPSPTSILPL